MVTIIIIVIVVVIVGAFLIQNSSTVSISFLSSHFDASLAVIALLFFLAGMIAGTVLAWTRMRQSAKKKKESDQKRLNGERPS